MTQQHNLGHFEQQAERLDREIAALHANQHRRASHLAAHRADQVELDSIGDELRERVRQQTNRVVQDPPSYITKTLGKRPVDRAKDRAWVSAVVEIEQYRLEHNITDGRTVIGPAPTERDAADAWHRVNEAVYDARDVIAPPKRAIQPEPPAIEPIRRRVEGPSLDIGF